MTHPNRYWGTRELPSAKAEFFNAITTPAPSGEGSVATIRMYGPIDSWGGYWGISTKDMGSILDALPESVTQIILRINSPGGEVFEGVSILNMLRAHKAKTLAVVDGLAASAASVIAAGCDDTVMSPGTQMMIHKPWVFALGDAEGLRKTASVLDGIEASITEIYESKAGAKDWPALLADETWMTAAEAVDLGLADRVAVIPDAGEAETVGVDPIDVDSDEDAEALTPLRAVASLWGTAAATTKPPVSSEPGDPNRTEPVMPDSTLKAGLRERLGVTDADVTDEALLASLDGALDEATKPTSPSLPDGAVVIDAAALEELRSAAAEGAAARTEQIAARRDGLIAAALKEGRIAPASAATWRTQLDKDEDGTKALLDSMPKNTVPVAEIGHADEISPEGALAAKAGWTENEEA